MSTLARRIEQVDELIGTVDYEIVIEDRSKFEVPKHSEDVNMWQKIMDLKLNTKHLVGVKAQRVIRSTNAVVMPSILLPQSMEREQRLHFCDYESYNEEKKKKSPLS